MTFKILDLKYGASLSRDRSGATSVYWVEATIELMANQKGPTVRQYHHGESKAEAAKAAYRQLQEEMAAIHARGEHIKDGIESVKSKFLALLDLCGIKDADIPQFHQSSCALTTRFGIMSKSPAQSTPQRSRHVRRDPSSYADMLIEQLMAQASSVTDSDTSPPSAEETPTQVAASQDLEEPETKKTLNNNDEKVIPLQLYFPSPSPQICPVPSAQLSPSLSHQYHIPPNSENGENIEDPMDAQQNPGSLALQKDNLQPLPISEREFSQHHQMTIDSSAVDPEGPHPAVACTYVSVIRSTRPGEHQAVSFTNATAGPTPELPTSDSSDSLEVPFASLFDELGCSDNLGDFSYESRPAPELIHCSSDFKLSPNPASPILPQATYYSFPLRYSESYARELNAIETAGAASSKQPSRAESPAKTFPCAPVSSACHTPEPGTIVNDSDGLHQSHFTYHQPLVVNLPPKSSLKPTKHWIDRHNYNSDRNYKPHMGDKIAEMESNIAAERPPVPPRRPLTDTKVGKLMVQSESSEIGTLWLSVQSSKSSMSSSVHFSAADSTIHNSFTNEQHQLSKTAVNPGNSVTYGDESPRNISWSYHDLPNVPDAPQNSIISMSTGKAHQRAKQRMNYDRFITVRPKQPVNSPEVASGARSSSASKRRKGNDKGVVLVANSQPEQTFPARSARQRLSFTPVTSPTKPQHSLVSDRMEETRATASSASPSTNSLSPRILQMRKKKRHSPAMRRLLEQKENNALSPSQDNRSPRRPLGELYNIKLNESDVFTTSSNSLTPSPDVYAKSSETSPDMPLPSRDEDILDRDAYYCDFTVDRQHKIDSLISKQTKTASSADDQEDQLFLEDSATSEILVRKVEGAESSPSSFVFQAPPLNFRPPRAVARTKNPSSSSDSGPPIPHCTKSDVAISKCSKTPVTRRSAIVRSKAGSRHSSHSSHHSSRSSSKYSSPTRTRSSSRSSRSSSGKKCTSHPVASSTLIMEPSTNSVEAAGDNDSIYIWSIDDESSPCSLEKSYLRSTKKKRKARFSTNTPRPPTSVGQDSPENLANDAQKRKTFEITAMVSKLEKTHQFNNNDNVKKPGNVTSFLHRTTTRALLSDKQILAADTSILKTLDNTADSTFHCSEVYSHLSSNQASTTSAFLNRAKASLLCSSNEGSALPEHARCSGEFTVPGTPTLSRQISASLPNLRRHYYHEDGEGTYSPIPTDTDDTPSDYEDRMDVPGKSSTSGSSSPCTAARCRPRIGKKSPEKLSEAAGISGIAADLPADAAGPSQAGQDLLDSILTDSPKSVDSSGIFAPYNSYNSPVESVGSHNGYSSTVSSSVTSSDTNCNKKRPGFVAPPSTPPHTRSMAEKSVNACTFIAQPQPGPDNVTDSVHFKRPFSPAPHVRWTNRPHTRNQGVTADPDPPTPHRPMSVRSDPLANQSMFAVPPGVVTGPPKIKDKKSLVRKLKKFSSNFYKKTEKIQTLANL